MKFKWEDSLLTGYAPIDKEHQELIDVANGLFEALSDHNKSDEEVLKTLDFLTGYVVKHFNNEERIQKKFNYPNCDEHHQIHEEFKAEVIKVKQDIEQNGLTSSKKIAVNRMLIQWLTKHIGEEDRKVGLHIQSTQ